MPSFRAHRPQAPRRRLARQDVEYRKKPARPPDFVRWGVVPSSSAKTTMRAPVGETAM